MLNWSDHEGEDVENGVAQVYGMIAGAEDDAAGSATGDATGDVADDVSNAAAEFALMGISSQIDRFVDIIAQLKRSKTYQLLSNAIQSQTVTSNVQDRRREMKMIIGWMYLCF
ncbi:hypothetical protein Tco_1246482 [Tanacetum coccineum]